MPCCVYNCTASMVYAVRAAKHRRRATLSRAEGARQKGRENTHSKAYVRHSSNPLGLERLKLFPSGELKGPWRPGIFKDRPVKLQLEPRTTANSRVFPAYVGTISYPSLNPVSVPSFKSLSDYSPSQCDGAVIHTSTCYSHLFLVQNAITQVRSIY